MAVETEDHPQDASRQGNDNLAPPVQHGVLKSELIHSLWTKKTLTVAYLG